MKEIISNRIIEKKYWFNDRNVIEMEVKKIKTEKGKEYIKFQLIGVENK